MGPNKAKPKKVGKNTCFVVYDVEMMGALFGFLNRMYQRIA